MRCASPPRECAAFAIEREITQPDFEQKLQAAIQFRARLRRQSALLLGKRDLPNELCRGLDRELGELMDVQLACHPAVLIVTARISGFEPRAVANLTGHARHERANPIAGKFALGLFVKPLHLRHQTFERSRRFLRASRSRQSSFRSAIAGAEVERLFEFLRQIRERHVIYRRRNVSPARSAVAGNTPASALCPRRHGEIAPSASDFVGSEIISSGSKTSCVPSP